MIVIRPTNSGSSAAIAPRKTISVSRKSSGKASSSAFARSSETWSPTTGPATAPPPTSTPGMPSSACSIRAPASSPSAPERRKTATKLERPSRETNGLAPAGRVDQRRTHLRDRRDRRRGAPRPRAASPARGDCEPALGADEHDDTRAEAAADRAAQLVAGDVALRRRIDEVQVGIDGQLAGDRCAEGDGDGEQRDRRGHDAARLRGDEAGDCGEHWRGTVSDHSLTSQGRSVRNHLKAGCVDWVSLRAHDSTHPARSGGSAAQSTRAMPACATPACSSSRPNPSTGPERTAAAQPARRGGHRAPGQHRAGEVVRVVALQAHGGQRHAGGVGGDGDDLRARLRPCRGVRPAGRALDEPARRGADRAAHARAASRRARSPPRRPAAGARRGRTSPARRARRAVPGARAAARTARLRRSRSPDARRRSAACAPCAR